jgi:hypothetical protein
MDSAISVDSKSKKKTFREAFVEMLVKQYLPFSIIEEKSVQQSYLAFLKEYGIRRTEPNFVIKDHHQSAFFFQDPRFLYSQPSKISMDTTIILRHLEEQTGFLNGDLELLDCFFVCYEPHTDSCLLSFNVLLNSPHEFIGGGTRFVNLNQTKKISQGEALLHSAKMLHEGVRIEEGRRIILVGFVESASVPVLIPKKHCLKKSPLNLLLKTIL